MHLVQILQVAGALLILAGFAGAQVRLLDPHSRLYLGLNELGAVVLTVVAALDSDWGFLLLEAAWALVTAWSILRLVRAPRPAGAH
jgi:hypothetical protein